MYMDDTRNALSHSCSYLTKCMFALMHVRAALTCELLRSASAAASAREAVLATAVEEDDDEDEEIDGDSRAAVVGRDVADIFSREVS